MSFSVSQQRRVYPEFAQCFQLGKRVSLAPSRAVFFSLFCSLMGHEPKLMNRDKCTWLCFVKEKLPKIRGNAFGCFARFAQQHPTKSVPQPHLFS